MYGLSDVLNAFLSETPSPQSHKQQDGLANYALPLIGAIGVLLATGYYYLSIRGRVHHAPKSEVTSKVAVKDILDHMKNRLHWKSEKYLKMSGDEYGFNYFCLKGLFKECTDEKKLGLSADIALLCTKECRLLLQYLTKRERKCVKEALDKRTDENLLCSIQKGLWESIFKAWPSEDPNRLTYVLIAAYCKGEIDMEDLATAMIFHRAWVNSPQGNCKIRRIDENFLEELSNFDFDQKSHLRTLLTTVRDNQRFVITVDSEIVDHFTLSLIRGSFYKSKKMEEFLGFLLIGSEDKPKAFGTFSYGIIKVLFPAVTPIVHLTPTLEAMSSHVEMGFSDFALFFPKEEAWVHGSKDKLIFSPLHDLLHTYGRARIVELQPQLMKMVSSVKVSPGIRERYTKKLQIENYTHPIFKEDPTEDEALAFLTDYAIGKILDGGYPGRVELGNSLSERLKMVLVDILKRTIVDAYQDNPKLKAVVGPLLIEKFVRIFGRQASCLLSENSL